MQLYCSTFLLLSLWIAVSSTVSAVPTQGVGGGSFNLVRSSESPEQYNVIVSNSEEVVVSAVFSIAQLKVFRDMFEEARAFALTNESVGRERPMTTRFSSRAEPALFVDIAKFGNQSQFFITLANESGRITIEAGSITRGSGKSDQGLFFDIKSRITKAASTGSSPN